jgi:hypothetical protein
VEEIPYIDKVVHIWRTLFHFMDRIPEES